MPVSYHIDPVLDAIFLRAEGLLTDDQLIQAAQAITTNGRFHPELRMFSDYSAVGSPDFQLTPAGVKRVAEIFRFQKKSRRAILVSSPVEWGMARMYVTYSGIHHGNASEVFVSRAEAVAFLNENVSAERMIR